MKQRILHLLIAIDQLAWVVLTLGKGHPDETISAALWRMEQQRKLAGILFRPFVDFVFQLTLRDHDHCRKSFESERDAKHLHPAYRS